MHIRLIAVGDRQPPWVNAAFDIYSARLPRQWQFSLQEVAAGRRGKGAASQSAVRQEGKKVLESIKSDDTVVLLDEKGVQLSSKSLSLQLEQWLAAGRDLTFVIGGPDGVGDDCRQRANYCWSMSKLTLPHGLARIMFAEQLYRAWSIGSGHPYHRE